MCYPTVNCPLWFFFLCIWATKAAQICVPFKTKGLMEVNKEQKQFLKFFICSMNKVCLKAPLQNSARTTVVKQQWQSLLHVQKPVFNPYQIKFKVSTHRRCLHPYLFIWQLLGSSKVWFLTHHLRLNLIKKRSYVGLSRVFCKQLARFFISNNRKPTKLALSNVF